MELMIQNVLFFSQAEAKVYKVKDTFIWGADESWSLFDGL